jgi:hypothetical protein
VRRAFSVAVRGQEKRSAPPIPSSGRSSATHCPVSGMTSKAYLGIPIRALLVIWVEVTKEPTLSDGGSSDRGNRSVRSLLPAASPQFRRRCWERFQRALDPLAVPKPLRSFPRESGDLGMNLFPLISWHCSPRSRYPSRPTTSAACGWSSTAAPTCWRLSSRRGALATSAGIRNQPGTNAVKETGARAASPLADGTRDRRSLGRGGLLGLPFRSPTSPARRARLGWILSRRAQTVAVLSSFA